MGYVIWHNPRCSKSRASLAILEAAGVDIDIRRYRDEPPSAEEILAAAQSMGRAVRDLVRFGEQTAKDMDLAGQEHDDAGWAAVLASHPELIERPVVLAPDGRAVMGRPPEAVHDLL